jgi:hypothetical protein
MLQAFAEEGLGGEEAKGGGVSRSLLPRIGRTILYFMVNFKLPNNVSKN